MHSDMNDEFNSLVQFIEETQKRLEGHRTLRKLNHHHEILYPSEADLAVLDSSIKKNSGFVKKLKSFNESSKESMIAELDRLNLTKFTSEVALSIIEAKLKISDISSVVDVCTKLNQSYPEFHRHLLEQYSKYFPTVKRRAADPISNQSKPPSPSQANSPGVPALRSIIPANNEVQSLNLSKIRVDLRLFAELILSGLIPAKEGFPVLANLICYLMVNERIFGQSLSAILTFCKGCGHELLGLAPLSMELLAQKYGREIPHERELISEKRKTALKAYIVEYYERQMNNLFLMHNDLKEMVNKGRRTYSSRGDVTKELRELVDMRVLEFRKVANNVQQLGELLGSQQLQLPDLDSLLEDGGTLVRSPEASSLDSNFCRETSPACDDEGDRNFYEDVMDLKLIFPELNDRVQSNRSPTHNKRSRSAEDVCKNETSRCSTPTENDSFSSSSSEESLSINQSVPLASSVIINRSTPPEGYFNKLSNCVNRDTIDQASIDFVRFFNTKFGRKKLVKTLFNVQRTRLDLLPFYARLVATLNPYVTGVGHELVNQLRQEFRNLFTKKDQINIESKVKNVRFIGELVKFELYSKQEALTCLRMLLSDFTHHHIEMTCYLLETCGRVLYQSIESHQQTRLMLEQMMRKKLLLSVDSKYITMIENAYYFTNPPEIIRQVVHEPPVHLYVRYMLCEMLDRSTIERVLAKVRSLDWSDPKLSKFVINCMIEAYQLKFYNIRYLAALLAALSKDNAWIATAVIDGVVEDIVLMLEVNELQFNQRRIPMVRYFGELFNYRLSDSTLVFRILHTLITYGVYYPEPGRPLAQIPMSRLDPPDNLFRIRLVCDLLETCGQFLDSGQDKRKLECYILFFQRYYWYKRYVYLLHPYCIARTIESSAHPRFPPSVEHQYNDAIMNLRPNYKMAASYLEAVELVDKLIN